MLSAAKNPRAADERFFAALSMTAKIAPEILTECDE